MGGLVGFDLERSDPTRRSVGFDCELGRVRIVDWSGSKALGSGFVWFDSVPFRFDGGLTSSANRDP